MTTTDRIKERIAELYKTNPNIHINVSMTRPKIHLENESVVIKGVYSHIFQIEEYSSGSPKSYTLQYSDVLIKQIEIAELNLD